jgi:hypothetical protein
MTESTHTFVLPRKEKKERAGVSGSWQAATLRQNLAVEAKRNLSSPP